MLYRRRARKYEYLVQAPVSQKEMHEEEFHLTNKWYKPKRHWKEIELWKDVPEEKWNDWLWQLTHTVRTLDDLKK